MKATRELIDAMRETADRLENKDYDYYWKNTTLCNVGSLAKTVMKIDTVDLNIVLEDDKLYGYYSNLVQRKWNVCPQTGIPLATIFRELYKVGVTTPADIIEIENAATTRDGAIAYFRTKANQLESQLISASANKVSKCNETIRQAVGL